MYVAKQNTQKKKNNNGFLGLGKIVTGDELRKKLSNIALKHQSKPHIAPANRSSRNLDPSFFLK